MNSNLRLISFKLCPYVQRSVILLREKKIVHDIEYIDLANKPDWFLKLSPMGKVPVLQVADTVLFESLVIMEYLDEVNPPSLHLTDPLQKAQNRAWIEFVSNLLGIEYQQMFAKTESEFQAKTDALLSGMQRLEDQFTGPWFNGAVFGFIDAAIAPFFGRIDYLNSITPFDHYANLPKLKQYATLLAKRDSIKNSVLPEVPELFRQFARDAGGYMSGVLSA
jgi:glutathione S-transferase